MHGINLHEEDLLGLLPVLGRDRREQEGRWVCAGLGEMLHVHVNFFLIIIIIILPLLLLSPLPKGAIRSVGMV
ncbi:hypothetical protein E2C01_046129 [Portunus trituberculatus]|uniref:Uncharacterized protein n=1 Tax=Portunus trituberculatus TaxID=210409 RepID=A0A5B7G3U5_PORTR|nr:hypothetical protein [Portunus trituberculatus]